MPFVQSEITKEQQVQLHVISAKTGQTIKSVVRNFIQAGIINYLNEEIEKCQKKTTKANDPENLTKKSLTKE